MDLKKDTSVHYKSLLNPLGVIIKKLSDSYGVPINIVEYGNGVERRLDIGGGGLNLGMGVYHIRME